MKRHGQGEYTYPNLDQLKEAIANNPNMILDINDLKRISFSGEWNDDEKVRGTIIYRTEDKYEGELFKDLPHGKGVHTFDCGSFYKGEYQDDMMNGYGIYTWFNGSKYNGSWYKNKRHGIGEFRWANGDIYKGCFTNDYFNGIGLLWSVAGNLYQGTFKNNKLDGLAIIHFQAYGSTAYVEFQNGLQEGLQVKHTSDIFYFRTCSKDQDHGLQTLQNNDIILMEFGKTRRIFNEEEAKQIIEGTLDVTQFFEKKEESTKRLMAALKGRPVYLGQKEREDIMQRANRLREEVKELRQKHRIEDPPEYAAGNIKEVIQFPIQTKNIKNPKYFIKQVIKNILPIIDGPDPILTLLGTLSILCNRIKLKNQLNIMNQDEKLKIKMEDKYFNERVLEHFLEVLNHPSEIVTNESENTGLIKFIKGSFIQLMNIYFKQHQFPVSTFNITMDQFDLTVAYEINFLNLMEQGQYFQKALNQSIDKKIQGAKYLKPKSFILMEESEIRQILKIPPEELQHYMRLTTERSIYTSRLQKYSLEQTVDPIQQKDPLIAKKLIYMILNTLKEYSRNKIAANDSGSLEDDKAGKTRIKMQEFLEENNLRLEEVEESKTIPEAESIEFQRNEINKQFAIEEDQIRYKIQNQDVSDEGSNQEFKQQLDKEFSSMETTSDHSMKSKAISTYNNSTIIFSSKDENNNYRQITDKDRLNAEFQKISFKEHLMNQKIFESTQEQFSSKG